MKSFRVEKNKASANKIYEHLTRCDFDFKPNLSSYVDIDLYSNKLFSRSERIEIWVKNNLVGLLAAYINIEKKTLFISNLSLEKEQRGKGLGVILLDRFLNEFNSKKTFKKIILEVESTNLVALKFYKKLGFSAVSLEANKRLLLEKKI